MISITESPIVESLWSHSCSGRLKPQWTLKEFTALTGWKAVEAETWFNKLVGTGQLCTNGEEYWWGTSKPNLQAAIVEYVKENPGVKGTALAVEVIKKAAELKVEANVEIIYDLAKAGVIKELEYSLPGTNSIKSLFFPAKTEFQLNG